MPLSNNYDRIFYPNNVDAFHVVANGNTPDSIVDARLVNKISNALMAIESHMQYSTDTPTSTGYFLLFTNGSVPIPADLPDPGLRLAVTFSLPPSVTQTSFNDNPFSRNNAIFVSGTGYSL